MKNFLKIAAFVCLPVIAMVVLTSVAQLTMQAPTGVTAIVETGEVWYNPVSWALNESAEHATMQANKSLTASVSYTQIMALVGAMVTGIGLTMLTMAIRQGWVKAEAKAEAKAKAEAIIEQAPAATSTPEMRGPSVPAPASSRSTSSEDARDTALSGQPMATATA
jgi:hypothetical protein